VDPRYGEVKILDSTWTLGIPARSQPLCCLRYPGSSQMDIELKQICDIRTWRKHLFLDISSTNINRLVPPLYQCVETRRIEIF
jgi:hypothetical protein